MASDPPSHPESRRLYGGAVPESIVVQGGFAVLAQRLRELAFLNKGLSIKLVDERTDKEAEFCFNGGIISFVEYLNKNKNPLHNKVLYTEKSGDDMVVEIGMQYNDSYAENIFAYANNINTIEGGTHLSGFKSALTRAINSRMTKGLTT